MEMKLTGHTLLFNACHKVFFQLITKLSSSALVEVSPIWRARPSTTTDHGFCLCDAGNAIARSAPASRHFPYRSRGVSTTYHHLCKVGRHTTLTVPVYGSQVRIWRLSVATFAVTNAGDALDSLYAVVEIDLLGYQLPLTSCISQNGVGQQHHR